MNSEFLNTFRDDWFADDGFVVAGLSLRWLAT